jgi:beta-mannosidase
MPRSRANVEGHEVQELTDGWEMAAAAPDSSIAPSGIDALAWLPMSVPGTAAGALRDAGRWQPAESYDFDAEDWWFRTSFTCDRPAQGEEVALQLDGIATLAEVYLNGEQVLDSESMFLAHEIDIGALLRETNDLAIRCRALAPRLQARRRPRARWRTRLVAEGNLRFFRTMLLGRAPGFAPGPAPVGPWRGVRLQRRRAVVVEELTLRATFSDGDGRLEVHSQLRGLAGAVPEAVTVELSNGGDTWRAPLELAEATDGVVGVHGELLVADALPWWPHTHGEPALYEARLIVSIAGETLSLTAPRVGFRSLAFGESDTHDIEVDGLDIHVNGVRVFARGCVWTPLDHVGLAPGYMALRRALEQVRDAGMNMLRIPGTSAYEERDFYELCDELGILVWQDFMFANLDYPIALDEFRATVIREAEQLLAEVATRPSLAVLCGNSEIEQQVAMLGLDPSLGRDKLFGELLPTLVRESATEAAYVPSAPCGGDLPFRTDRGIANYYGVGGYRRPLTDVRRAEVRFAAECLAFSNVPDDAAIEAMLPDAPSMVAVHDPLWKAGVPRDVGAGWDFEDVRDHYLREIFGLDPTSLRSVDLERYLELSRMVSGEVMAAVFGEWRRAASPCGGALVLWLRDLAAGAGWGVVDHRGEPKVAYHHLRRALAPVAVWMTDEGLGGVAVHAVNERPEPLGATLRVALYRDLEHRVDEAQEGVELAQGKVGEWGIETLLGHFVDASWAYRFGPPAQDLIVASLERAAPADEEREVLSQSVFFPVGPPLLREPLDRLGLRATTEQLDGGDISLSVSSTRLAYGVRVHAPGFSASDDAFSVEPGGKRSVLLSRGEPAAPPAAGWLTAVNLRGRVAISLQYEDQPA